MPSVYCAILTIISRTVTILNRHSQLCKVYCPSARNWWQTSEMSVASRGMQPLLAFVGFALMRKQSSKKNSRSNRPPWVMNFIAKADIYYHDNTKYNRSFLRNEKVKYREQREQLLNLDRDFTRRPSIDGRFLFLPVC